MVNQVQGNHFNQVNQGTKFPGINIALSDFGAIFKPNSKS